MKFFRRKKDGVMADKKEKRTETPMNEDPQNPQAFDEEVIEGEIVEDGEDNASVPAESISVNEYNALSQELEKAQEQAKVNFDGWQRERADFSNYKRRIERDQQQLSQKITGDVIKKYLGVLDDLERALKSRPTEGAAAEWAKGIELICRKLQNTLESEGIKRIPAEAEEFNPERHEAITYEESPNHESGQIIEVLQQGYTIGDRVLRPAMVRVAR